MPKAESETVAFADPFDVVENQSPAPVAADPEHRTLKITSDRVEYLQKNQITMSKPDPASRSFSKEFAERLALSIKNEGLLNPPIVVKSGDKFEVRAGRHRCYACYNILKWETVPFLVLDDGPDDLSDAIDVASNLFASPLTEKQARVAVQKWYSIYLKNYPQAKNSSGKAPKFAKEVQAVLGVSKNHAHRIATTAANVSPEDRVTLENAGVTQSNIDEIAAIKDPEAIDAAVKLTASGMDAKEAVRQGKKIKAKKVEKVAEEAGKPVMDKEKPKKPSDATDEEWLSSSCAKIHDALPNKKAFKRDAILYRRILDSLVKLRTSTKKALAEAKHPGENGLFYASLFKVVRASHPSNWFICDRCNGKGHTEDKSCGSCLGGGYRLKFEET